MRIDAHHHFWRYNPIEYDWIDDAMASIRRDFLPTDLAPEIAAARLIALLPQAGSVNTAAAATLRPVAANSRSGLFIGLAVLALLLVGYFVFEARASNAPGGGPDAAGAITEPAARR